jgi:hypothetical protein
MRQSSRSYRHCYELSEKLYNAVGWASYPPDGSQICINGCASRSLQQFYLPPSS